jgi:hypothetical protein
MKSLPNDSVYKVLPDLNCTQYIADMWHDMGEAKAGGMSLVSMEWSDVASYSTFYELDPWDASMMMNMSRLYVNSLSAGKDPSMQAPYCKDPELAELQTRQAMSDRRTERRRMQMLRDEYNKK